MKNMDELLSDVQSDPPPILPVAHHGDLPLSFAQQRLWFINQVTAGSSTYNIPHAYRVNGSLNVTALEQSLTELVRRHEILRTTFPNLTGQPQQVITTHQPFNLSILNLQDLPGAEQEMEVERQTVAAAQQPFDLVEESALRVQLLRLAEQDHVLLVNMHHIISDVWSFDIFFRELTALYTVFSADRPSPLPALPIQYADFTLWQRKCFSGEVLESQLAYWQQQFRGNLPILQLPTDYPRPPIQTYAGAYRSWALSPDLTTALIALSQEEGVTLFMTLLAAFQVLLCRYSGQEDIIVGTPIAGRNQLATKGLIGCFGNTVALRTDLSGNPSFRQLLSQVRAVTMAAYDHQDLPLEKLIEELNIPIDPSRSPLFQVMFAWQNIPSQPLELPGLIITPLKIQSSTAKFDLTLSLQETAAGIQGGMEYNRDLFEAATITRMLGHLQTLLQAIVTNPDQHLASLPLLTAAEQDQLLVAWNNTQSDYPNNACIHQLFVEQVERTPEAVAVVFAEQQLTYRELNQRANQLAHHLKFLGVKPDVLVGICVERSLEMIVALLAILKAGGAYVPLDPTYPVARLAFILDDAHISILLTRKSLVEKLSLATVHTIYLDSDGETINCHQEDNPLCTASSNNLSYVTYTSGSTGQPKGVCVTQRGVVRLVKDTNYANLHPGETFLQLAPLSFDASTFEIWGSLLNGGRLVVFSTHTPALEELGQAIRKHQVTSLWLTAGLFHLMVDEQIEDLKPLKQLLAGGDVLSLPHVQKFIREVGDCQLINGYGPTENTTFTCCYHITGTEQFVNSVPIGRPIANTQVYILDPSLQPVPIGVPGELYVGGDGLARGYLNKPELTAEKFIFNPFSDRLGDRLYKTGDLARYRSDGNIEFLGRIDHQVKIRGFRIELGEVEAVLSQHVAIQQTVVIAREDNYGNKYLVAYLVLSPDQITTVNKIRRYLIQKMPEYMVPSAFVFLDTLPLTANGKIDRQALPAPDFTRLDGENNYNYVPPRNALELQLTKIWEQVLDRQPIGIKDNFFDLGGHSLLAVRLFAQIEKVLQTSLPLSAIFQAPTIAELARVLRAEVRLQPWYSLVPIQPQGSRPILFGIHTFYFDDLSRLLGTEQPIYGLRYGIAELADQKLTLPPMAELAAHYIEEMRSLQPTGPYFLMGLSAGGTIAYEMSQQLMAQGQQVELLVLFDTYITDDNSCKKLLPISQRLKNLWQLKFLNRAKKLENLWQLGLSKFLTRAKWKLELKLQNWKAERLTVVTSEPKYCPHTYSAEPLVKLLGNYIPQPYAGRVILFQALDNVRTSVNYSFDPPDVRLRQLVYGELEVYAVPGSHIGILEEPHVQLLAEKLRSNIDRILAD